ncbi:MAG: hypothetical protein HZA93_05250 [Verrucomicrobia bacterium]|nr:hypothetical protein [Verrucomicrobiota bacterium]
MNSPSTFACPACRRSLYDRKRTTCGYCGARLPDDLRFSKPMRDALERGDFTEKDRLDIRVDGSGDYSP